MSEAAADRIRTLLLRADNLLKNEGDPEDRRRRARTALDEARELTELPGIPPRVAELVYRRIEALDDLES